MNIPQLNQTDQTPVSQTYKTSTFKYVVFWFFGFLSLLFVFLAGLSIVDNIFGLCDWQQGFFFGIEASCSSFVFQLLPDFINLSVLSLFLSYITLPLLVFISFLYVQALLSFKNDIRQLSDVGSIELKKTILDKNILLAFPLIILVSLGVVLFTSGHTSFKKSQIKSIEEREIRFAKEEQEYREVSSKNPNFCEEDTESYLTEDGGNGVTLHTPSSYWAGYGVVLGVRENYWEGSISTIEQFRYLMRGLSDLTNKKEIALFFPGAGEILKDGNTYDIRVYTFKDKTLTTSDAEKFTFYKGVFEGKRGTDKENVRFDTASSSMITTEKCISVPVR